MTDAPPFATLSHEDVARLVSKATDSAARVKLDPETIEADLARLVLGLMEFLRQLMELQAIRRMENGSLTSAEEERVGDTLMRAEAAIQDLARRLGIDPKDLSLDLGPLGRTI